LLLIVVVPPLRVGVRKRTEILREHVSAFTADEVQVLKAA
jgi:hypothetical protein